RLLGHNAGRGGGGLAAAGAVGAGHNHLERGAGVAGLDCVAARGGALDRAAVVAAAVAVQPLVGEGRRRRARPTTRACLQLLADRDRAADLGGLGVERRLRDDGGRGGGGLAAAVTVGAGHNHLERGANVAGLDCVAARGGALDRAAVVAAAVA